MKAFFKSLLIVLLFIIAAPPAWIFRLIKKPEWADTIMIVTSRLLLLIISVRLTVKGQLTAQRPLLVVTNHLSYLDVPLLASQDALRFTPKIEISRWPFFGWICRITGCIFVTRKTEKLVDNSAQIRDALTAGEPVCLFPEGTTGNGIHVQPFKSSFFSLAEEEYAGRPLTVQPVAIAYRRIRNLPIDFTQWPDIAWYGDMNLVPHLWNLMKLAPISVELIYLPPVSLAEHGDRKQLAKHCQQVITDALIAAKN